MLGILISVLALRLYFNTMKCILERIFLSLNAAAVLNYRKSGNKTQSLIDLNKDSRYKHLLDLNFLD